MRINISPIFIFAALLMVLLPKEAKAQTQTASYRPGVTPEGVVYYLPKTAVRIAVRIEKTTYTPGDFSKYADRYLRIGAVESSPKTEYKVIDTDISTFGMADTKKAYSITLNPKTSAPNVTLSDEGILLAVNATANPSSPEPPKFKSAKKPSKPNPRQYMSQEILSAGSVAKMAQLTAEEIYNIRESRNALIKGEADFMPSDGEQLKLMLSNLQIQEEALLSCFTGYTETDTTETIFTFCPNKEIDRMVLFRLSQKLGIVANDDLAGAPYYVSVEDLKAVVEPEEDPKAKAKKADTNGLWVNVPGKFRISLFRGLTEIDSHEARCAQFGYSEMLAGDIFNKKFTTHLTLIPETGGISKLDLEQPK